MATHYVTPGNIFKETFILYRETFFFNFAAIIILYIPFLATLPNQMQFYMYSPEDMTRYWIWYASIMSYMMLGGVFISYIITRKACLTYQKETKDLLDLLKEGVKNYLPLLLLSLLFTAGVLGGTLLLIVPGIILTLAWCLILPLYTAEGLTGRAALKRSHSLTKGFKGEIFGVGFILGLIIYVALILLMILFFFLFKNNISSLAYLEDFLYTRRFWYGYTMVTGVLSGILTPLYFIIPVIFYFNLVKEKEGFTTKEDAPPLSDK
jgi:hypothetical protein